MKVKKEKIQDIIELLIINIALIFVIIISLTTFFPYTIYTETN